MKVRTSAQLLHLIGTIESKRENIGVVVLTATPFSCKMRVNRNEWICRNRCLHACREERGCDVRGIASFLRDNQTRQKPRSQAVPGLFGTYSPE